MIADTPSQLIFQFFNAQPFVGTLLLLMFLDIIMGTLLAFVARTINSTVSWAGMTRKVVMLLVISVGALIEPYAGGVPVSRMVAFFYIFTESISILENAARMGVPLPGALVEALEKLRSSKAPVAAAGKVVVHTDTTTTVTPAVPPVPPVPPVKEG